MLLTPLSASAQGIEELLRGLGDPSPDRRLNAETQIARMGLEARPALIAATRGDDPAISSAATQILLSRLPWYRNEDPGELRQLLQNYGAEDEPGRVRITSLISQRGGQAGVAILLRLILEDPSEDVCWKIVTQFCNKRTSIQIFRLNRDPKTMEQLRQLDPPSNRPAALVLSGLAWYWTDHQKGLEQFRKAVEAEVARPTHDDSELDYAFDELTHYQQARGRYDQALHYRRLQANRVGINRDAYPLPIYQLFVLHGRFGPLPGFDEDVRKYGDFLGDPGVMYALSRAYARAGRTLEALACEQTALASGLTPTARELTSQLLQREANWNDMARREAYAALNNTDPSSSGYRIIARRTLAQIATEEENDAAGIEHYSALQGPEVPTPWAEEARAQVLIRMARIAQSRGEKDVTVYLDDLVKLGIDDTDLVQNSYPLFVAAGREKDAVALFNIAYENSRKMLAQEPDNPIIANDLAWLCARCDQKLDEALALAENAVKVTPDSAAHIDTLAEVQFRRGNAAEAARLETRAVELEPENVFMLRQLARFKAGVK